MLLGAGLSYKPVIRWPFIIALVGMGGYTSWRMIQDPLRRDMVSFSNAVYTGNARGLMAAMLSEEISGCGVTERNLSQLWREHIKPRFDLVTQLGSDEISGTSSNIMAERQVRYQNGLVQSWGTDVDPTGEGGKTRVLATLLMNAYRAEAQSQTTRELDVVEHYGIWAGYIERDRPYFESLGLKGVFGPNKGVMSWEQWAAELRAANTRFSTEEATK